MYLKRVAELDHITDVRNDQRKQHDELRRRRLDEFMAGFTVITTRLKEMYQMITLGGDAELELVDSLDPFSEGIVFRSETSLLYHQHRQLSTSDTELIYQLPPFQTVCSQSFNLRDPVLSNLLLASCLIYARPLRPDR